MKITRFICTVYFILTGLYVHADQELIPSAYIQSLLSKYSEKEKKEILADLNAIRSLVFSDKKPNTKKSPIYLATAGAPLSRKSTILEKEIHENPLYQDMVYIDPDQRALKFMSHTYISQSLSNYKLYKSTNLLSLRREAYEHWREASNFIANTLLNEAYEKSYDIAHGSTLTGNASPLLLEKLKKKGYEITLLLSFSSDSFKKEALHYRNNEQGFYQVTDQDFIQKAKLFPKRFQDYKTYADHILFYYSKNRTDSIEPVASWSKVKGLKILNEKSYIKIKKDIHLFN